MDLQWFARAITIAVAVTVFAVAPLSAQTTDTGEPEAELDALEAELDDAFEAESVDLFFADLKTCLDSYRVLNPEPTTLCLSKTVISRHDFMLPYADSLAEKLAEASPDPDSSTLDYEVTLGVAAALLSDPGFCFEVEAPGMREFCSATIAQIDDDPHRCEAMPDPGDVLACLMAYFRIDPGDVGDCHGLGDIGIDGEDIGHTTGADWCFATAATQNDTPSLCREIENAEVRSYCILGSMMPPPEGWTDISICDEIVGINLNDPREQVGVTSPEGLREICRVTVAVSAVSSPQALGMCNEIETPLMRDACLAGAANAHKDGSYCDHIASAAVRKLCLDHQAGVKDEDTLGASNAFTEELLALLDDFDAPDQVVEGQFDAAALCSMLGQPADCLLRENSVDFKLRGDVDDVDGMAMAVVEIPSPVERCPAWTSRLGITFTGGFVGMFLRETLRGGVHADLLLEAMIPPSKDAPCELKVGDNALDGTWEATMRDGTIEGVVRFQGENGEAVLPFITRVMAE